MDVERLAKELILKGMTSEQQKAVLDSIKSTMTQAREVQKQRIGENVQVVVQALKKIEGDIRSRYDEVGNKIEKRVASLKDGQDGRDGRDGKDGKDGRPGRDGSQGPKGTDGLHGRDGQDGQDGVSVTDAHIDFDGSLTITLSNGREINVGEVVAPDLAERIKVITNGGGTSQYVMDALESLENVILGAGTANGVAFLNASKVLVTGSALTFDGTNLGVGTSTPVVRLQVEGNIRGGSPIVSGNYTISLQSGTSDTTNLTRYSSGIGEIRHVGGPFQVIASDATALILGTSSTERMRIDSAGNVGIGTSAPGDKLEIGGSGAGIILASPDGTRYRITVSNLGVLTVAAV